MVFYNFKRYSYISDDNFDGIAYSQTDEDTIMEMLIQLNRFPKCEATIGEPVMNIYVGNHNVKDGHTFQDLNDRLNSIGIIKCNKY